MSDYYKNTPEIIFSGLDKVKAEIIKNNLNIEMKLLQNTTWNQSLKTY